MVSLREIEPSEKKKKKRVIKPKLDNQDIESKIDADG